MKIKNIIIIVFAMYFSQSFAQTNPIIPGDWSDPAVIRVEDNYYCLRSTFGWWPGLQIIHSKDLIHWKYLGNAYSNTDFSIDAGETKFGIWGSELVYNPNTKQYLVYAPIYVDSEFEIYVFYADEPEGPYASGPKISGAIDPGVFVDSDSSLYFTNQTGKIFLLTDDGKKIKQEVGQRPEIDDHAPGEGPEILRHNDFFYYLCSAGGTCPYQQHKILSFRAKSLSGPWEADPENPLKFAPHTTKAELQGPGHGELFQTQYGEWLLTYQVYNLRHATLGRQTCLEQVVWTDDGWWRPKHGKIPPKNIEKPGLPEVQYELQTSDDFNKSSLGLQWFFHTWPDYSGSSWSLTDRMGFMRLKSGNMTNQLPEILQRFILQRMVHKSYEISTKLEFSSLMKNERAGLILYNNPQNYIMFGPLIQDNEVVLEIKTKFGLFDYSRRWSEQSTLKAKEKIIAAEKLVNSNDIFLKIKVFDPETAHFYYSMDNKNWHEIKGKMPLYFGNGGAPDLGWKCASWTGGTIGIFLTGNSQGAVADFDFFKVKKLPTH